MESRLEGRCNLGKLIVKDELYYVNLLSAPGDVNVVKDLIRKNF